MYQNIKEYIKKVFHIYLAIVRFLWTVTYQLQSMNEVEGSCSKLFGQMYFALLPSTYVAL